MGFEQAGSAFIEQNEELTPLERFERLLGVMADLADKHATVEHGWYTFPQRGVTIKRGEKIEKHIMQFFIFAPQPLSGYESASYNPSITMELGRRLHDSKTGKRLTHDPKTKEPLGEFEQFYVTRAFLDKSSPYFPTFRKYYEKAVADLDKIDEKFYSYKNTIEFSRPIE